MWPIRDVDAKAGRRRAQRVQDHHGSGAGAARPRHVVGDRGSVHAPRPPRAPRPAAGGV